ncbi:DUF1971 domain-containing protein [Devosia alba]|uniref:DUF1971 domain-containing protein n=1 Tax=Devosia alba TaxID=3152360 RepID=UPI0032668F7E
MTGPSDVAAERHWPAGITPYKRTPDFTETTIPAGLLKAHSTKTEVWAQIHVQQGQLRFRDLETGTESVLPVGVHQVIFPQALHEVEPAGAVRFYVEFHRA